MEDVKDFFTMAFSLLCLSAGIFILFRGISVLERFMDMGG